MVYLILGSTNSVYCQNIWINAGGTYSGLDWVNTSIHGNTHPSITEKAFHSCFNLEAEYLLKKKYSLSTAIGFYQSGGKVANAEETNPLIKFDLENDKMSIPFFFVGQSINVYPISKNGFRFQVSLGPRFEMLKGFKEQEGPIVFLREAKVLNEWNIGITGGMGAIYDHKRFNFRVKLSQLWKTRRLAETDGNNHSLPQDFQDLTIKESITMLTLGVGYKLRNK